MNATTIKRISLSVCLLFFLLVSFSSEATHFRYGTITWRKDLTFVSTSQVRIIFNVKSSWRYTYPWPGGPSPIVGSTVSAGLNLFIVNGVGTTIASAPMNMQVTAINVPEDYLDTDFNYTVLLPITGYPFKAYFEQCCRVSTLANNADQNFRVETTVTVNNNNSPVASMPAIINMPTNVPAATYPIFATDPDGGLLTYALAPSAAIGGPLVLQAPGLSISGSNFVLNTVGKAIGTIWNGIINIRDSQGGVIAVDVIFKITGASTPPSFVYGPTPANSTQISVRPLDPINFAVRATDSDPGDIVSLIASGLPAGVTFSTVAGNPANATFSWTPTAAQIGTYIIVFTARDVAGVTRTTTVTIRVSVDPEFIAPTLGDGSILCATPGDPISTTFTARDLNVANTVSISTASGLRPGMTFSPSLPTLFSNPATTNFSWTPSASDWGAQTLTMRATSQVGYFKNTSVTWVVDTRPSITSFPSSTTLAVGQLFTYTVIASDSDILVGDHIDIETSTIPSFLSIVDNGNNTFTISGTPTLADLGPHNIEVELEDLMNHYGGTHCGNVHQDFSVNVVGVLPEIICPANITVNNTPGQCGAIVNFVATETVGNPASTITYSIEPGSYFAVGSPTTVTATATNSVGSSSCNFTITVKDNEAPIADEASLPTISGECSASAITSPTATDNCEGPIVGTTANPTSYSEQGTYTITWTFNDGNGNTSQQTQTVIVDDVTPPVADEASLPTISGECSASASPPTATDNCEGTIVGTTTDPISFSAEGTYTINWTFNDGNGNTSQQTQTVIVEDVTPPSITCPDDITQANDATLCSAVVTFTAPVGTDNCSGVLTTQIAGLASGSAFPVGVTTNTFLVTDASGNTQSCSFTVTVTNVAPVINSVSGLLAPVALGTSINIVVSYTDNDVTNAAFNWDDGTGIQNIPNPAAGSFTVSHTYAAPGVYSVFVTLTDICGASSANFEYQYIVIYDPNGGFVTGGGWINSPAGAYIADPLLTGRANFGFVAKYKKGSNIPDGSTEFKYQTGNLNFKSSVYDAGRLVIAGASANFKGIGTINGSGNYGFMIAAVDGQVNGGGGIDKFRMKIWDINNADAIVYDNNLGLDENGIPTTAIAGGSIVIHSTGKAREAAAESVEPGSSRIQVQISPNPASDKINLKLNSLAEGLAQFDIRNTNGKLLLSESKMLEKGENNIQLNIQNLPAGMHFIQIKDATKKTVIVKLIKN